MQFLFVLAVGSLAGVTIAGKLDQFWADNFKAFEKIYGKTNDKQIYGATLPPPVSFEGDLNKDASDNKEHFYSQEDFSEPYNVRDSYKDPLIDNQFKKRKPNFISYSDFKPISKNNDPETYNFLKHLDEIDQTQRSRSKSKPRDDYSSVIEDSEAYKSIHEILDAHETKKSRDRGDRRYSSKIKKSNRLYSYGPKKSKCPAGSCRQRIKTIRVRTGPYIKSGKK